MSTYARQDHCSIKRFLNLAVAQYNVIWSIISTFSTRFMILQLADTRMNGWLSPASSQSLFLKIEQIVAEVDYAG